jgi:hypothetical protein
MMLVDATYWPLVVIGPVRGGTVGPDAGPRALARLASSEPRAIALVVPGHGEEAASALETLLGWLREFEGQVLGPAARLAWVAPDRTLRATLDMMLDEQAQRAFGCPSSTFAALLPALVWLFEAVKAGPGRPGRHRLTHRLTEGSR